MTRLVRDIGEFALIADLERALPDAVRSSAQVPTGIGDDCAVWRPNANHQSVITTDALVDGVHFRLDWTDFRSLGHKSLAINLSDIASMGAQPVLAAVTLALTGQEAVADLVELYRGMGELAATYGVVIAGGDIVRTHGPLMISLTVIGEGDHLLRRSGAKVDDVILVSGTLGASGAGLRLLAEEDRGLATAELLIGAHLRPSPRVSLGRFLATTSVTACMDLSDGLTGDLPKILTASGVGALIHTDAIPILPAVRAAFPSDALELALSAGEDYELLLTAPAADVPGIIAGAKEIGATLTPIGTITAESGLRLRAEDGQVHEIQSGGWDHFGSTAAG